MKADGVSVYTIKHLQINQNAEQTYHSIRNSIVSAQHRLSAAVNSTMVITYWEIGEQIYKACGENDRAEYGKKLLDYLSEQLTVEFGKGFTVRNLRAMRQFYCLFPIRHTLCAELSWSHYRQGLFIQKNVQNLRGVSGNWNGRSIQCTTNAF